MNDQNMIQDTRTRASALLAFKESLRWLEAVEPFWMFDRETDLIRAIGGGRRGSGDRGPGGG